MVSTIITKYLTYSREPSLWLEIAITTIKNIEDHKIHDGTRAKFCTALGKYQMLKGDYHDAFVNFARAVGITPNPEIIALWHEAQHALNPEHVIPHSDEAISVIGKTLTLPEEVA